MSCSQNASAKGAPQAMVDQRPKFDNSVWSRKAKIYRPRKKRKKDRYL